MPTISGGSSAFPTGSNLGVTWTTYDCAPTGFSGTPTQSTSRYALAGKLCVLQINVTGTSNATTFTITAPFQCNASSMLMIAPLVNAGTNVVGLAQFGTAPSTTITLFTTVGGGAWTASGTKAATFTFPYETV